ncbi:MAG: hypothetical protein ABSF84_18115, partial [Acidimicrobiales bacterium]
ETITGGTGTKLVITSTAFSGGASISATNAFTVTLEDAYGNATTKASAITVNLSSTSGTGTFSATSGGSTVTSVTLPANTTSVTAYYGDTKAGTPTITAAATGLSPSATQGETITAGTAAQLVFTTTTKTGPASASPTVGPITVQEQDAYGNVTTTAMTVNLSSSSTGTHEFAATSGGTAVTSINITAGNSTATFYYGDQKAGAPVITAAATGLTSGTQAESITALTGTQLAITSTAFSGAASASATNAFTVTLEDTYGNTTTKATATTVNLSSTSTGTHEFAATSGGTAVTSVTLPANTSSVTAYYGDEKAGTPTITAAATGLSPSGTQGETITAGAASKLVFTTSPVTGTHHRFGDTATAGPITVQEQDAYGNVSTSAITVNLSSSSGGGIFAATSGGTTVTSINITAGNSTATFYYGDTVAGSPVITVTATGMMQATQTETMN